MTPLHECTAVRMLARSQSTVCFTVGYVSRRLNLAYISLAQSFFLFQVCVPACLRETNPLLVLHPGNREFFTLKLYS